MNNLKTEKQKELSADDSSVKRLLEIDKELELISALYEEQRDLIKKLLDENQDLVDENGIIKIDNGAKIADEFLNTSVSSGEKSIFVTTAVNRYRYTKSRRKGA